MARIKRENKIKYSIIIALAPWRNAEILQYIKTQEYPKNKFEVIIEKGLNVPINRNNGVKKSKGEIIIFLDDDAIIEKDYLKKVDNFFNKHRHIHILGGPQLTPPSDNFFARSNGYTLASKFGGSTNKRYKQSNLTLNADSDFLTGANIICKKEVFNYSKFDPSVYPSDDVNFTEEAKRQGFNIAYSPEIYVFHRRRDNFKALVKQIFDYGRARPKKNFYKNIVKKPRFAIPSIFFLYLIFMPTLLFLNILFITPLIIYFIISVFFSIAEGIKNNDPLTIIIMPFLFLTIHLTYGIGFIIGILDKLFTRKKNDTT